MGPRSEPWRFGIDATGMGAVKLGSLDLLFLFLGLN